jgi:hypothetical protein
MSNYEFQQSPFDLNDQLTAEELHELRAQMDAVGYDTQIFDPITGLVTDRPAGPTILDTLWLEEELGLL